MSPDHRSDKRQRGILRYIGDRTAPFTLSEIIDHVKREKLGSADPGRLVQDLEATSLVFPLPDERFLPRWSFFEEGSFVVSLTDREVADRVLVPGHRFIPFVDPALDPSLVTIETESGALHASTTYRLPFDDAVTFHSLYGVENLREVFTRMDRRNDSLFDAADPRKQKAILAAYEIPEDLGPLEPESLLRFTVVDWRKGTVRLAGLEREGGHVHPIRAQDWIERLDRGFHQCFNYLGLTAPISEQLAYGFFFAGALVLKNPPLSFASYLDRSDFTDYVWYGGKTRLWRQDEEISDEILSAFPENDLVKEDPLELALDELRHPLTAVMVEALIRNSLVTESESAESIIDTFFSYPYVEYESDEQEQTLRALLHERSQDIHENFREISELPKVPLRERILDLLLSLVNWLERAEDLNEPDAVGPQLEAREIRVAVERAESFLRVLNDIDEIPMDLLADLVAELEKIESVVKTNQHIIDTYLESGEYLHRYRPSAEEPGYRLERHGEATSVYQLRIALVGVQPEIWRRVLIPDNYALEALHVVIQESMGWTNSHLHEFYVGNDTYGVPEFDENTGRNLLPESDYALRDVAGEIEEFDYVYHLASEWRTRIRIERRAEVEDVKPLLRGVIAARCIGGERAGPPEDSGGPAEFLRRLSAQQEDPSSAQLPVGYDPDEFDEEEVNRRLSELEHSR
jgi:hypothetical protein